MNRGFADARDANVPASSDLILWESCRPIWSIPPARGEDEGEIPRRSPSRVEPELEEGLVDSDFLSVKVPCAPLGTLDDGIVSPSAWPNA
mmetsp:Transcript_3506/g.9804  ORF Transcript_3506/g.9804 Transcript_3506/m.9804 type:complete len:90 (-) Transcript_3506:146-415(-)|eukprot:scaffold71402_cov22-Tisochrysis_lutea.AAC.1